MTDALEDLLDVEELAQEQQLDVIARRNYYLGQLSDTGAAERFIRKYHDRILYVWDGEKGRWHVYANGVWAVDALANVYGLTADIGMMIDAELTARDAGLTDPERREYRTFRKNMESHRGRSSVLGVVASDERVKCNVLDMDSRRDLIALPNGKCIELGEHGVSVRMLTREDRITYTTRGVYDETHDVLESPPERVKVYMDTFIPDLGVRRRLQKTIGNALFGDNADRIMPILIGKSTSGKSQLTEAIDESLGGYAAVGTASILRGNMDDKARPDVIRVINRRLVFLNEAAHTWQLHGDKIKDMTGGAPMPVRKMRADDFLEVKPFFTPFIVTNVMPRITGAADDGLKRRLLVFDFNEKFTGPEDPSIKQAFIADQEVMNWLLTWAVEGYVLARQEGMADVINAQAMSTTTAFESLTHSGEFLTWLREDDRLTVDDAEESHVACVKMADLYLLYRGWLLDYGDHDDRKAQLKFRAFNDELRKVFGWEGHKCGGSNHWVGKFVGSMNINIGTILSMWFSEPTVRKLTS